MKDKWAFIANTRDDVYEMSSVEYIVNKK